MHSLPGLWPWAGDTVPVCGGSASVAREPGTSPPTHLLLPVGICLGLFSEPPPSGSDLGLCEPEWLGLTHLPTPQGKDGLEHRPLVLSGSDVGGEPCSPQGWFCKQFSKHRKEIQTPGRGRNDKSHSPCLLYLYPSDCQKCRLGPGMRTARLGKRPSACYSVHTDDQQGESTARNQAACEVRLHALPHPQIMFSPKSTSKRRGEGGAGWRAG